MRGPLRGGTARFIKLGSYHSRIANNARSTEQSLTSESCLRPPTLSSQLVRKNFKLVKFWRVGKQITGIGFLHQGGRHFSIEVRLPPGLVIKCVEDGEGGRSFLNGEPSDCPWFRVYQWYCGTQKIRDLPFLAWLRL